jgi:uncharacterized protein
MKIFDFNVHLPSIQHEDVNRVIENDMSQDASGILAGISTQADAIKRMQRANIMLFNRHLFDSANTLIQDNPEKKLIFTCLIDFRRADALGYIDRAAEAGVKAIMFNSYLQQISDSDFLAVHQACRHAVAKKMVICIDGSFGTSKMYAYDNVRLACFIADLITTVPIIIVHSGGKRVLDVMLLALDKRNIFLDTSFSLPYYIGSSVEQDMAFAFKKIGTERILFGSDHPYINFHDAIKSHTAFFDKHSFSSRQIEQIMHDTAGQLFG